MGDGEGKRREKQKVESRTLNHQLSTINQPWARVAPDSRTVNPQTSTLNRQPSTTLRTLNPQPSTLNPLLSGPVLAATPTSVVIPFTRTRPLPRAKAAWPARTT